MSTPHKRHFDTMNTAQCAALARLCNLKGPLQLKALHMYAVQGCTPKEIEQALGIPTSNILRQMKKAQDRIKDAKLLLTAPPAQTQQK